MKNTNEKAINMVVGAATVNAVNGNENEMDWSKVESVDFSDRYTVRYVGNKVSKKGVPYSLLVVKSEEFVNDLFVRVYDNGADAKGLRFGIKNISVINYKGEWVPALTFKAEFRKFINDFMFGKYPNAVYDTCQRNAIYRDGKALDTNELIVDKKFYGVGKLNKKENWLVAGSLYVELGLGYLKQVTVLDSVNSKLPFMSVCDRPMDATKPYNERKYPLELTKAVKNALLGSLLAEEQIVPYHAKTAENYMKNVHMPLLGESFDDIARQDGNKADEEADMELEKMTKAKLLTYCADNGIDVKKSAKKAEILEAINAFNASEPEVENNNTTEDTKEETQEDSNRRSESIDALDNL